MSGCKVRNIGATWSTPVRRRTGGTVHKVESGRLRLRLLGRFGVEGDLTGPAPTGKAERLLKVLAAKHGQLVPVGTLVDALWLDHPPDRADRNIAVLVSRLRRSLGRARILGGPAAYQLVLDGSTVVDLFEAAELVTHAERELAHGRYSLAAVGAEQAEKLLTTAPPLVGEVDSPWAEDLRQLAVSQLRRARGCQWRAALELGDYRAAVEVAVAALAADPLDEEACRAVMVGHQRAGAAGAALTAYHALRSALAEAFGADPSETTRAVFLSVLRADSPSLGTRLPPVEEHAPPTLVGRDAELEQLLALWSRAAGGAGATALVLGEAGIGKSSLAAALAARIRQTGGLVLATGCFEAERSLYLQPLVAAVRVVIALHRPAVLRELAGDWLGTLLELVPDMAQSTGSVPYQRAAPELEHLRCLEAVAAFLDRLAQRQPLLLMIEDGQHAGQSTVEALHVLATRLAASRVLVLVLERTPEDDGALASLRDLAVCIELGPLSEQAVGVLVARSGLRYDPTQLYEWTGGSPLFVTELLRHSAPVQPGGAMRLGIPGSLHEAVAGRLARAGDEVAGLLEQGAVLGSAFSLDEVAALSGINVEECARRAGRALRAGLLVVRAETFRFANDVVRQVAYDSTPMPVRISRHRRAAKLFEARPEAAARQFAAAQDYAAAARAWLLAAHAAHLAFANREAERLLDEALSVAQRSGGRVLMATVLMRRGEIRTELGRHGEARDDLELALGIARDIGDELLEARVLEQLGWTALYARDALGAVDLASRARALAESAAAAPGALPSSLLLVGRVRHWDGDYTGAASAYDQVVTADPGDTTTAVALAYRGALLQHMDRFAEARAVLERAAVLCRSTGLFRPLLQTLFFIGLARGDVGEFEGALRALGRARRMIDEYGVSFYRAGIDTTTAWLLLEMGDVGQAREHAQRAVELAHRGGGALELEQELHALLALADCDLLDGHYDDAGSRVEAAVPMLEQSLPYRPRATMRLLEMQARFEPAQAEALLAHAQRYSSTKYESLALWHLGRYEQAAAIAAQTGSDLLLAQVGQPGVREAALNRIAASLAPEVRTTFLARGRLRRVREPGGITGSGRWS
ncbi:MAG: ATP-binding protein [Pseudonocardiaceae bacterium]